MTTNSVPNLSTSAYAYRYDQLHRIKNAFNYTLANNIYTPNATTYTTNYGYNPDGNLTSLNRYGNLPNSMTLMDQLSYAYSNSNRPNQLSSVSDLVNPAIYPSDIDGTHAYMYVPIGNLIKETVGRNNTNITWDVYNKVTSVDHENPSPTTYFTYDSQGNRVSKLKSGNAPSTTYYIKDAQGNTISVYNYNSQEGTKQSEA